LRTNAFQEGGNNVDIQSQLYETRDEEVQAHKVKNEVQNLIQDLGGLMTREKPRKIQEAL